MTDVVWSLNEAVHLPGVLFITNYQLQFLYNDESNRPQQRCISTMGSITRVEKLGGQKSSQLFGKDRQVVVYRKDFHREVTLTLRGAKSGDRKVRFSTPSHFLACSYHFLITILDFNRNDQQIRVSRRHTAHVCVFVSPEMAVCPA